MNNSTFNFTPDKKQAILGNVSLSPLFFVLFFASVVLHFLSAEWNFLYYPSIILLISLLVLVLVDCFFLFWIQAPLSFSRSMSRRLHLGDINHVVLSVHNKSPFSYFLSLYEGFPTEMQERKLFFQAHMLPSQACTFSYDFIPKKRGQTYFNDTVFVLSSFLHLANRRYKINAQQQVDIYPSLLQVKKHELQVFHNKKNSIGIKKIRRLGNNSEFEQIKKYVQGDQVRFINWKATSRTNTLMVNTYQEEKSQHIVCLLDKSRMMQMEVDQLSLLDYSINSILTLSNIFIKNGDKTGLITFSNQLDTQLFPSKNPKQLPSIMEALYNQQTHFKDPDFSLVFQSIRQDIKTRSLLILFTNFETESALNKALPTLTKINKKHVLVVVLFLNQTLEKLAFRPPKTVQHVYQNIVVEQIMGLKTKMARLLQQNKIQVILTHPHELSIHTINKYLELKAKGYI